MNRKKRVMSSLLLLAALGMGSNVNAGIVKANEQNPDNPTKWQGQYKQVGKLRYGLVETRLLFERNGNKYPVSSPSVELVPDDAYENGVIKESKVIRHIFDAQIYKVDGKKIAVNQRQDKYKRSLGSSFGLTILEDEIKDNKFKWNVASQTDIQANFFGGTVSGNTVSASGTTAEDFKDSTSLTDFKTWDIALKMTPDATNSAILHTYTVTNKSNATKTFTPIKLVDTQLDNNDFVQVFSRGPGKGLYIETYEDSLPYNVRPKGEGRNARLDYIINPSRGTDPVQYSGNGFNFIDGIDTGAGRKFSNGDNLFGELGATTPIPRVSNEMSASEGTAIFGWDGKSPLTTHNAIDTAIYLNWGQKTLAPGQSTTLTYEVGMKELSPLDLEKTYENKNPKVAGQNTEGDVITYKVKVASPEYNIKDIVVTDPLSKYFEEPAASEKVVLTNKGGATIAEYSMSEVFAKNTNVNEPYVGTLTIPTNRAKPSVTKNDALYYTYDVKLAKGAGGQSINNTAKISASTEDYRLVSGEASTKTSIDVVAGNTPPRFKIPKDLIALKYNDNAPTNLLEGVDVEDDEDGPITNITVSGNINMGARAQNTITYTVKDSEGLTATATRTYVVGGFVGQTHVLFVEDFVVPASSIGIGQPNLELAIKQNAKARVEKRHDKTVVSNINTDIQVPNLDGYSEQRAIYLPEINTTIDPSISGKTVALVGYENNAINGADGPYTEGGIVRMTSLPIDYTAKEGTDLLNLIPINPNAAMLNIIDKSNAFAWDSTTRDSVAVSDVFDIYDIYPGTYLDLIEYKSSTGLVHKNTITLEKTR